MKPQGRINYKKPLIQYTAGVRPEVKRKYIFLTGEKRL